MQGNGVHEVRDGRVGEDICELAGGGTVAEVLLPAPAHDIQVQHGAVQLLQRVEVQ